MSIRTRLALGYSGAMVLTFLVIGVVVWSQTGNALRASLDETLRTRAIGVLTAIENDGQSGLQEPDQAMPGVFAAVFSPDGSLTDASPGAPPGLRPVGGVAEIAGHRYLLHVERSPTGATIVTGADLRPLDAQEASVVRLLVGAGLAAAAASVVGGWWLAGRALRPVDALIEEATTLGAADLGRRLPQPAQMDEIGRLALTLNGMLDRIDASVRQQQTFVAMASHDLRTPLAALRAELELADHPGASRSELRRVLRAAHGDVVRLGNLANGLLELATVADTGRTLVRTPVRVDELLSTSIRGLEPVARQQRVSIACEAPAVEVRVDRGRLEQALANLISNAITYSPPGSSVQVQAAVVGAPGAQTLKVEVLDRGPGLGAEPPERLFAPFQRGPNAIGLGSGLGLATAAAAIRAHRGSIGAANRDGGGARFWFAVPC